MYFLEMFSDNQKKKGFTMKNIYTPILKYQTHFCFTTQDPPTQLVPYNISINIVYD